MADNVAPEWDLERFNCPHCGAFAHQSFYQRVGGFLGNPGLIPATSMDDRYGASVCYSCGCMALWDETDMVYPRIVAAPDPHPDMPGTVLADFNEARQVAQDSPSAAAALLRRAIEKLCIELDADGGDLNAQIGDLVKRGLAPEVQQALDVVRVTGNGLVHPGVLDPDDTPVTVVQLFAIVNEIVARMVSFPKQMKEAYDKLPESKREAIDKRDGRSGAADFSED